jgi:hypothetical protein
VGGSTTTDLGGIVRVRTFLLADAVDIGTAGKIYVHGGGINQISPPTYPWTLPQLGVLVTLEREEEELGSDHYLRLTFVAPSGETIGPELATNFRVPAPSVAETPVQIHFSMSVSGVRFPTPGVYAVEVAVDRTVLDRLRLVLAEAPALNNGSDETQLEQSD